jgi:RNA polymerase sigma-70 factor, ECF subfamily
MQDPNIDAIVSRIAAGDEQAFAALYDQFAGRLVRAAFGMLGRREDAEDAVQEVFWTVSRSRKCLVGVQDMTAYLFASLRRAVARCAKRRAFAKRDCDVVIDELPALNAGQDLSGGYGNQLECALASLPMRQRQVVVLKIDGDLTFAQIAEVLGVSINTASSRYRYALQKLRDSLNSDPGSSVDYAKNEHRRQAPLSRTTEDGQELGRSKVDGKLGFAI